MKKSIQNTLFITLLIVTFHANAQQWQWATTSCGGATKGIAVDTNSHYIYVAGYYETSTLPFDSDTLTNNGLKDIFIVKYNADGNSIWAKSFGGTSSDQPNELTIDKNGNIYVAGTFESASIDFGSTNLATQGSADAFLLKLDTNGNVVWVSSAGNTDLDRARSVVTDSIGNIYVVGEYKSTSLQFDSFTLVNTNSLEDIFIAKYTSSGSVVWANSYGAAGSEYALDIDLYNKGQALYITGSLGSYPVSFGSYTLSGSGSQHVYVLKCDWNGNVVWADSPGGSSLDWGKGVDVDTEGDIYFSGYFSSASIDFQTTTLTNAQSGYHDIYLVKYDKDGNVKWANRYGESGLDWGYDISTTPFGTVFITGYYNSSIMAIDTITLYNNGNYDIWIAEFDSLGNVIRAQSVGGSEWDAGIDVVSDEKGNAFLAGGFSSTSILFDTISLSLCSSSDMLIAKWESSYREDDSIDDTTYSIHDLSGKTTIVCYPNPASNILYVINSENTVSELDVIDMLGNKVSVQSLKAGTNEINCSELTAGFYYLVIRGSNREVTKKRFVIW